MISKQPDLTKPRNGTNTTLSPGRITIAATLIFAGFLTIALTIFPWSALAVDGTNLPGHDYTHFDAPSAFVCRNTCGGESKCQAYTWVKPGFQGPHGQCWLKDTLPNIVKDKCCDSGSRESILERDLRAEDKINRPGSDFKNFTTDHWDACESACAANEMCSSWTFVRSGGKGPSGRCWLKSGVARPVADPNMISGVKFKPASVRID